MRFIQHKCYLTIALLRLLTIRPASYLTITTLCACAISPTLDNHEAVETLTYLCNKTVNSAECKPKV